MSRKVKSLFFVFVIASLVLSACGGAAAPAETGGNEPIKVGAIFDLTGATGDVGTPYSEGVKGYVEWLNAHGGVEGRPIELISADYAYKVDVAEQLYSQYASEGVERFHGMGDR
jgi:branched-chain amino acid transport system substrate-binding protein